MGFNDFTGKKSKTKNAARPQANRSGASSQNPQVTLISPVGGAFNVPAGVCPLDTSKKCPSICMGLPVPGMCHHVP